MPVYLPLPGSGSDPHLAQGTSLNPKKWFLPSMSFENDSSGLQVLRSLPQPQTNAGSSLHPSKPQNNHPRNHPASEGLFPKQPKRTRRAKRYCPARNTGKSWDKKDNSILTKMDRKGTDWSIIADTLGRTETSCKQQLLRLKQEENSPYERQSVQNDDQLPQDSQENQLIDESYISGVLENIADDLEISRDQVEAGLAQYLSVQRANATHMSVSSSSARLSCPCGDNFEQRYTRPYKVVKKGPSKRSKSGGSERMLPGIESFNT